MGLSVVVLTYNEELHIERCITSLQSFASDVFIVDSFSTDKTKQIAEELGAKVYQNKWLNNHSIQFNWGLKNCPIKTEWVMRVDADEYVMPELAIEIKNTLDKISDDVSGIYIKRRVYFMGKWIKHGGCYPIELLRIWRHGKGFCEDRWMDEHIKIIRGRTVKLNYDFIDHNLKSLTTWIDKHNYYATREAAELLNTVYDFNMNNDIVPVFFGSQAQRKRWLKVKYSKLPLFIRPFLYFLYRYFIRLGILDGKQGLVWCFLQGFWYRFLVDAKIYEIYQKTGKDKGKILNLLRNEHEITF
jgi:glycosyltransferase involved in cell wall biosynthesis